MKINSNKISEIDISSMYLKSGDVLIFSIKDYLTYIEYKSISKDVDILIENISTSIGFKVPAIILANGMTVEKTNRAKLLAMIGEKDSKILSILKKIFNIRTIFEKNPH